MNFDRTEIVNETHAEVLKDIDALVKMLKDNETIGCAKTMRETELKIVAETDKIAGKMIKTMVNIALNDEQNIAEGKKLAKSSPVRMKNHGKRSVAIHPYRGESFTAKTTYFCRAGVLPKKGLKKKGFSLN